MSNDKKGKKLVGSRLGAKSQKDISPNEVMIYAIAFNLAAHAFADIADAETRIKAARHKVINDQEVMTLSMRRTLDNAEAYALESIKLAKNSTKKKVH